MKLKKYGITDPRSFDYLLATAFSLFAIGSLWISIWLTVTKNLVFGKTALDILKNAILANVSGTYKWYILVESVLFWTGIFSSIVFFIVALARKRCRAIANIIASMMLLAILIFEINCLILSFNSGIYGAFKIFLIILILAQLVTLFYVAMQEYRVLITKSKAYNSYKTEYEEKPAKPEEPKMEEEQGQEPYVSTLEIVEAPKQEEEVDLSFKNSNEYMDYMYHDAVAKYIETEKPKKAEPKPKKQEKKEEDTSFMISKANNFTFEQKLKNAKPVVREYFKELKKYFEELDFKYAVTKQAATFSYKNTKYAQITTAGQNGLKIYYKLDVMDYKDSTIPVKYVGDVRKYENVPLLFVAKSDLAVKRAKHLMDDIKSKLD